MAAQIEEEIEQYRENTLPAIIQIPGVSGNTGAGVNGVKKTVEQAVGSEYSVWRSKLMSTGVIKKVAGPLVIAEGMRDANMFDVVRVSNQRLIGEIIEMHGDEASIQVYEETSGLGPGEPVESMEVPMSVELGPGLITSIYDGIQRPLDDIMKVSGNSLKRGVEVPSLKRNLKWEFVPTAKVGDEVETGDVIGTVQETVLVQQKIMVPYGVKGTIKEIKAGEFTVEEVVAVVETENGDRELTLMQKWPVRRGRPYKRNFRQRCRL